MNFKSHLQVMMLRKQLFLPKLNRRYYPKLEDDEEEEEELIRPNDSRMKAEARRQQLKDQNKILSRTVSQLSQIMEKLNDQESVFAKVVH